MYDACVPWPERPKGAKDKSRGPKGLELEVGARRAPKLLVSNIQISKYPNIERYPERAISSNLGFPRFAAREGLHNLSPPKSKDKRGNPIIRRTG